MKWTAISGSWRKTSDEVERDVRDAVRQIIRRGDGIITGGALNVDYFATDEALREDPDATHIKVLIPTTLERYAAHYRRRAEEGVITPEQAEELILQLETLKARNPNALIENPDNTVVDKTTYYARNTDVIEVSDDLLAFMVNDSQGVGDTIKKARDRNKPVIVKTYTL